MATSPIKKLFSQSDVLSRLQDHANHLLRLQQILDAALPAVSRGSVHVANLQDGELIVHAESPSMATRVRLCQDSIRNAFQTHGEAIFSIKVKVRTSPFHGNMVAEETLERKIGQPGKDALQDLGDRLSPDDPLARALRRMIDRSR
jgi:hypothetical protein